MADMCRDIRALKDEIVSLYTIMGESIKTDARRESDYLHLAARVERLEQRLDERDRPPLSFRHCVSHRASATKK